MSLNGGVWVPIGPSPMNESGGKDNGLVTTIAVNPNNPKVLFLGTAQGGVWRSADGGHNWTPIFDQQPSLGIGEPAGIAIDPANTDTIYVGTSSRDGSAEPDTIGQPAAGLFKSTDGGSSWIALGSDYPAGNTGSASQFVNQTINVIIVDPASGVLYLASTQGVFTSTDAGLNWTQATGLSGLNNDTRSLALDLSTPANARIVYAGVSGKGVFRSKNGGLTFTQVLSATTPAVQTVLGVGGGFSRVIVALAPPTSPANVNGVQVLYVALGGTYNGPPPDPIGVFLSKDQGATWTQQASAGLSGTTYGGYAVDMAVDPTSPGDGSNDILLYGCQIQFKSNNSGASFSAITVGHPDTHTWTMVPQSGGAKTVVYCGCDGGLYVSTDGGSSWSPLNDGGLQTGLFYNVAIRPDDASVTVGALQDNQVQTTKGSAGLDWNATFGGDGWDVAYDGGSPPVLYGSSGGPASSIFSSANDGTSFPNNLTPPWTAADTGGFNLTQIAADPSASGILYASGLQNLWQLRSGAWRIIATLGSPGNVDVAPTNGNNVVIAAGTQVWVSTNALAATVGLPTGVTFKNITPGLPGRNVTRAVFDPVDPTIIYAVVSGFGPGLAGNNVFRTTVAATSWTNISPALLNVPCGAIAVDGTTTPTTLYVGTDLGVIRSVDGGASWSVLDDIHFPVVAVFDLAFNAKAGMLSAATYGRGVFTFAKPTGPAIAVSLQDGLAFGTVCSGPDYLTITVYNVGAGDLVITSVQRLFGSTDFTVLPTPGTPLTIPPGEEIDFTVRFTPTVSGLPEKATIRIISNDPNAPFVDLAATGERGTGAVVTAIANSGSFGNVCLGSFVDELLAINNSGTCPLAITSITGSADFLAPSVLAYPILVGSGDSIDVVVRFQPSTFGAKFGAITIFSKDPAGPHVVNVSGVTQAPKANLIIADTGNFGKVCVGSFADEPLIITSSGKCTLSITGIVSASAEFLVPEVLSYPITIGPGDAMPVPIRFRPASFGPKSTTITVSSNDPASPLSITVSGVAPPGKLTIAGSTTFGGVNAYCCADRTLSICNVGDCALNVTSVHFKRKSRHWKLLHNPFPEKLRPGSCLPVVIQYHATERCSRICELVIESDDPVKPVKYVEVEAYTIWESCCKEDCDACRHGCCDKRQQEHSCRQGYPCCCENNDDDDENRKQD